MGFRNYAERARNSLRKLPILSAGTHDAAGAAGLRCLRNDGDIDNTVLSVDLWNSLVRFQSRVPGLIWLADRK
jgi:hypothetical protein